MGPDTLRSAKAGGGRAPGRVDRSPGHANGAGAAHPEPLRSHLEDGTRLAAETARRLCCDAALDEAHFGA